MNGDDKNLWNDLVNAEKSLAGGQTEAAVWDIQLLNGKPPRCLRLWIGEAYSMDYLRSDVWQILQKVARGEGFRQGRAEEADFWQRQRWPDLIFAFIMGGIAGLLIAAAATWASH